MPDTLPTPERAPELCGSHPNLISYKGEKGEANKLEL